MRYIFCVSEYVNVFSRVLHKYGDRQSNRLMLFLISLCSTENYNDFLGFSCKYKIKMCVKNGGEERGFH